MESRTPPLVGSVFGDKMRAKTDLSTRRIRDHARLIIIKDLYDVLKDVEAHTAESELLCGDWAKYTQALLEAEHHLFIHKEELEPARYPAEEERHQARLRGLQDEAFGDVEIDDVDEERDLLKYLTDTEDGEDEEGDQ